MLISLSFKWNMLLSQTVLTDRFQRIVAFSDCRFASHIFLLLFVLVLLPQPCVGIQPIFRLGITPPTPAPEKQKRCDTLRAQRGSVHSDGRIDLYQMWCKASSWCEECTSCKGDDEECRPWCCKACNLSSENLFFLGIGTERHAMCTILNLPPFFCNTRNTRRRPGYTTVTRHKFLSL